MFMKKKKAQSVLEYTLIVALIVTAVLVAGQFMKGSITSKINASGNKIGAGGEKFFSGVGMK